MTEKVVPFKRKKKIYLSPSEYQRIQELKDKAKLAINPLEVKLFRQEINSILRFAEMRRKVNGKGDL